MSTLQFETQVSPEGRISISLPPEYCNHKVVVHIEDVKKEDVGMTDKRNKKQERKRAFDELCGAWREDERSAEEIIRDIYESRTFGREREPL